MIYSNFRSRSRSPSSTRNEQSHSQNASTPEMADEDENRTHDNPSSDATYSPGNSTRSISHGKTYFETFVSRNNPENTLGVRLMPYRIQSVYNSTCI